MRLAEYLAEEHPITLALGAIHLEVLEPGEAWGARTLRNHGLTLAIDPTVWSRHARTHAYMQTTGGHDPKNAAHDGYLKLLVAIFYDLENPETVPKSYRKMVEDSNAWIVRWRTEARARAAARQEVRSVW